MRVFAPGEDRQRDDDEVLKGLDNPSYAERFGAEWAHAQHDIELVQARRATLRRGRVPGRPPDADVLRLGDQQLRRAGSARRAGRPGAAAVAARGDAARGATRRAQVQRRGVQDPGQHGPGAPRPHRLRARGIGPLRARHAPEGGALGQGAAAQHGGELSVAAPRAARRGLCRRHHRHPEPRRAAAGRHADRGRGTAVHRAAVLRARDVPQRRGRRPAAHQAAEGRADAARRRRCDPGLPAGGRLGAAARRRRSAAVRSRRAPPRARIRLQGARDAQPLPDRALGDLPGRRRRSCSASSTPTPTAWPTTRSMRRRCWSNTRPSCARSRPTGRRSSSTPCASMRGWCSRRSSKADPQPRDDLHDRATEEARRRRRRHPSGRPRVVRQAERQAAGGHAALAGDAGLRRRTRHACAAGRCHRPLAGGVGGRARRAPPVCACRRCRARCRPALPARRRGPGGRRRGRRAVVGARRLRVRPVQAGRARSGRADAAAERAAPRAACCWPPPPPPRATWSTRPAEHMGPAELAEAARLVAEAAWRDVQADRRRRLAEGRLPGRARRRPRLDARAAPDRAELGPAARPEAHAGRQGRVLRLRRPGHQGRRRHAPDEEGHGRRGQRARPGLAGDGARSCRCGCRC